MKKNIFHGLILILIIAFLLSPVASAGNVPDEAKKEQIIEQMHGVRVPFVENKGQIENDGVKFYARTFGGTVFVDENGFLSYSLPAKDNNGLVLKEIFTDNKINIKGMDISPASVNYFIGKDQDNWKTDIPSYNQVSLGEVYKGIEVTLQVQGNTVEKLFTVLPNENPKLIKIKLDGCKELIVNENGELEVITELGIVKFTKPVAFQEINGQKKSIDVAYAIKEKNNYGFRIGNYDHSIPLIIDPLLAATFIGGEYSEDISAITTDSAGNVYATGITNSIDYPTTPGVYNNTQLYSDVFVSKLDNTLSHLLASTFVGSTGHQGGSPGYVESIFIDSTGNIFVAGNANVRDYLITDNAYDTNTKVEDNSKSYRFFISKLSNDLSQLLASTFIGKFRRAQTSPLFVAMDKDGNIFVTGFEDYIGRKTSSIIKLDNTLSKRLGGNSVCENIGDIDSISAIKVGPSGNVYVAGTTNISYDDAPSGFTTTPGAYDTTRNCIDYNGRIFCPAEIFVSKFNNSLNQITATTLIGEQYTDEAITLSIDETGNAFIGSRSTIGDEKKNNIIYKLNHNLSELKASFSFNSVRFWEDTTNFSSAISPSGDIFIFRGSLILKLDNNLNTLITHVKTGPFTCFCFDDSGNIFLGGSVLAGAIVTPGAYDTEFCDTWDKAVDGYIQKITPDLLDYDGDGFSIDDGDCDDRNAVTYPNAPEICDYNDNDCDGAIDEEVRDIYCKDSDGDGYGNSYYKRYDCSQYSIYVSNCDDCNDSDSDIYPGAVDICGDGIDQDCDGKDKICGQEPVSDNDGDGYTTDQGDCNDNNKSIHPDATEICGDGIDQNCDGEDKQCIVSDIKANGSDGPLNIMLNDNLSITIQLSPGGYAGDNADWWLVAVTPSGVFHYQLDTGLFVPDLTYSHQGSLFNLGGFEVQNISFPLGESTLYFGVDMDMNGLLNIDKAYYDSVTVNVQ